MRKLIILLLISIALKAKSQVGYEDFYSENYLKTNLQLAKTPSEQIEALGILSIHYKNKHQDSLGNIYFNRIAGIVSRTKDDELNGRTQWWSMRYKNDTIIGKKLLQFAKEHQQVENSIGADLFLSYYYIHSNHFLSEKYVTDAKESLDKWKTDTANKDSLRIEVYTQAAHINIHRLNGRNVSYYMLALWDIAERHPIEKERLFAMLCLAGMYGEWEGHNQEAIPWMEKLYDHYRKANQPNRLLMIDSYLSTMYAGLGNKDQMVKYLKEHEKLADSLGVFGYDNVWLFNWKRYLGLITYSQFIQTLDDHFGNRLFLHQGFIDFQKAQFQFYETKNLDSAWYYLSRAKKAGENVDWLEDEYYGKKKNYQKLLQHCKELEKKQIECGLTSDLLGTYNGFWKVYELTQNWKPAFEYYRKARRLKDSLNTLQDDVGVATMNLQKQAEIKQATFDQQKKLQEEELNKITLRNRIRLYGFLIGAAVLLLIAVILWRSNRRKQKDKLKIEQAFNELKSTQQQLIQSEKMASLGELTAGIAHEIQNPLNFVNNFSDVNRELIDEMQQEMDKGNLNEAKAISNDIKENEEKIILHGRRADGIVKNMLQHSRSSSGQKEPTGINALADEYLRLAYHGLRAKDKSFNATMKTDFDKSIGNINIIPQDIGRVILNLINNAFYAVDEKKKQNGSSYEPTVSVSTKKNNGKIEVSVRDNGNGIPKKVLDKIFQPFFTTKPTGQGTGLGLSLAYDIVTKGHGGEIKVNTKEGEGTEFIIVL
jgi:signal transduction histidine kinase